MHGMEHNKKCNCIGHETGISAYVWMRYLVRALHRPWWVLLNEDLCLMKFHIIYYILNSNCDWVDK